MKRTEHIIFKRSYKKRTTKQGSQVHLLFFLLGLLSLFVISEKFSFLMSFIKPLGVEQVLAVQEVQDSSFLLSPTPALIATSSSSPVPLFTAEDLTGPTPTPTRSASSGQALVRQILPDDPKTDFCLDVPVFMYHHVQPMAIATELGHGQLTIDAALFDEHMAQLLAKGYTMISSEELVQALLSRQQLPEKSIVITIDDGYDDNYDYAYQTAKKYNIKMDFMIPTGLIDNPLYMTWDEVKEIARNPLMRIYNHTWSHTALGAVDKETIVREITQARKQLQDTVGSTNQILVYPYGSFSDLAIATAREQGYVAGISTIQGTVQCQSYIMTLHRTRIGNAPLSFYGF